MGRGADPGTNPMTPNESEGPTSALWTEDTVDWTWFKIVHRAVSHEGWPRLKRLYELIELHPKTRENKHWKARVRATLQRSPVFVRIDQDRWSRAELYHQDEVEAFNRIRREKFPLSGPRRQKDS